MAATTATRSTRRVDGLRHPHLYHPLHHQPLPQQSHSHMVAPGTRRSNMAMKRHLPALERQLDAVKRRKHFVVEIPSKPASHQMRHGHGNTNNNNNIKPATEAIVASSQAVAPPPPPESAPQRPPVAKPSSHPIHHRPNAAGTAAAAPPPPQHSVTATATSGQNKATSFAKHKEKVANGLKHELDRLQPNDALAKEPGRKLRSQEATRFKSDLSAYFPDYDEVIGNDSKEHHLLNVDTPIVIIDSKSPLPPSIPVTAAARSPTSAQDTAIRQPLSSYPVRSYGDNLFNDLCDSQRIDLNFLKAQHKGSLNGDPLPDAVFEGPHKKAERLERSIRNLEKGRAQHEKDQIMRLLDGLQGPDWLKIMGVSGITEGKKKSFEPARTHFIKGCQAILDKFRRWTAEEKRRKQEKERREREAKALRESQEQDVDSEVTNDVEPADDPEEEVAEAEQDHDEEMEDDNGGGDDSDGDPPDSLDVDASIAKQLRDEAIAAAKTNSRSRARARGKRRSESAQPQPAAESRPLKEFKSFFSKPYQRAAALSKNRRRGRTVLAWGHPLPEVPEKDFELPAQVLDDETLKVQARRKRKERRGKS